MAESRTELLTWVNELLGLNITKLEQCGTGAAYCQVFDSIYGDIPLSKVKFTGKREYEHVHNYKILQSAFNNHGVDKIIPVERLIKCKYQDNLDFLQWMKKYWDTYYPGGLYDAAQRRAKSDYTAEENLRKDGEQSPTSVRSQPSRSSTTRQQSKDRASISAPKPNHTGRSETGSTTSEALDFGSSKKRTGQKPGHSASSTGGSIGKPAQGTSSASGRPAKSQDERSREAARPATRGSRNDQMRKPNGKHIQYIQEELAEEDQNLHSQKPVQGSTPNNASLAVPVSGSSTSRKIPVVGNAVNLRSRTASNARDQQYDWEIQHNQIIALRKENNALSVELDNVRNVAHALERERNFYFSKLRDIEIVIRQKVDKIQIDRAIIPLLSSIQGIMYKTEDGFESINARNSPMHIIDEFAQESLRKDVDPLQYLDRMMPSTSRSASLSKPTLSSNSPRATVFGGPVGVFASQQESQIPTSGSMSRQVSNEWNKAPSRPLSGSHVPRTAESPRNRTDANRTQSHLLPEALIQSAISIDNDVLSAVADVDTNSESRFRDADNDMSSLEDVAGIQNSSSLRRQQVSGSYETISDTTAQAVRSKQVSSSNGAIASNVTFGSISALSNHGPVENILDEAPPANLEPQMSESQLATENQLPALPKKIGSIASLNAKTKIDDPEGLLEGHEDSWFGAVAS